MSIQHQTTQLKGGYSKWLADENLSSEIEILQQKLGITNVVQDTLQVGSPIVNCQSCLKKDTQIENLQSNLKEMEKKYKTEAEKVHSQQMEQFRSYKDSHSQQLNSELQQLKKAYEQLRTKCNESPKTEKGIKSVDSKELSKSGYRIQLLDEENLALKAKVDDLQKQLQHMKSSSTVVKGASSTNMSKLTTTKPLSMVYRTYPQQRYETLEIGKSVPSSIIFNKPLTVTSPIQKSDQLIYSQHNPMMAKSTYEMKFNRTPTFKIMADSTNNMKSQSLHIPIFSHNHVGSSVLNEHSFSINNPNVVYQNKQCNGCSYISNSIPNQTKVSSPTYEFDYNKDIVDEKWRSLSHKIKVLQKENEKLKAKILPYQR